MDAYYASQDFDNTIKIIKQLRKIDKVDSINTIIIINSYIRLKKIEEAENELNILKQSDIDKFKIFFIQIQINLAKNNFLQSLNDIEAYYDKYSDNIDYLKLYSIILRKFLKFNEAINEINKVIKLSNKEQMLLLVHFILK